jgi:hypothetical protein
MDVTDVLWNSVNKRLGECLDSKDMWFDEPDAGWIEKKITLFIPFHNRAHNPGLQQYTFPPFYRRSIVSVLRERMATSHTSNTFTLSHMNYDGGEQTCPTPNPPGYMENYTHRPPSWSFLEAHEEIQNSAAEPGCSLPRVLIGLMFGSDSTHLTSFGNASLWPCYMYFGNNESKYRRCKPTCSLCNHMAYFHKVQFSQVILFAQRVNARRL